MQLLAPMSVAAFMTTRGGHQLAMETTQLTERRRSENEYAFRTLEWCRDRALARDGSETVTRWNAVCECGDPDCHEKIELSLDTHRAIRADPQAYIVSAGHLDASDTVTEDAVSYLVVRASRTHTTMRLDPELQAPRRMLRTDSVRERRVAHNDNYYRDVNVRIEDAMSRLYRSTEVVRLVCECGRLSCSELVEIQLAAYDDIRAHPGHYLVAPGHEVPDADVVESHETYAVVTKRAPAAVGWRADDARTDPSNRT